MSMIENQIKELNELADYLKKENILGGRTVLDAIDTIKVLSAKVGAYDQIRWERDMAISQLEDLGISLGEKIWHCVADGDLPDDNERILYTTYDMAFDDYIVEASRGYWLKNNLKDITAWCELPKPYKED